MAKQSVMSKVIEGLTSKRAELLEKYESEVKGIDGALEHIRAIQKAAVVPKPRKPRVLKAADKAPAQTTFRAV